MAADQERCAALARLEKQDAQLADLGQQLANAICTCRSAAANDMADMQAELTELQATQLTFVFLCRYELHAQEPSHEARLALHRLPWQC